MNELDSILYMNKIFHSQFVFIDIMNEDVIALSTLRHTKMYMNAVKSDVIVSVHKFI
jgi:GH35 family endo-1,4-beta-xylanase